MIEAGSHDGDMIASNGQGQLNEIAKTSAQATAQYEMQSAVLMAKKFPRNEDAAFGKLMNACKRLGFAENCEYRYPRGGSNVTGPSVYLAREAARVWGNIRYGYDILTDEADTRTIRGWAWDLETNTKTQADSSFKKLVQRKQRSGKTEWVEADERDLRELTNRQAAFLVRNCILQLIPSDLIDDALNKAAETLENGVTDDNIVEQRKKIIEGFSSVGVSVAMLETYLKHGISACSPAEIVDLRGIFKSIKDGQSAWKDYVQVEEKPDPIGDLAKKGAEKKAAAKTGTVEPKPSGDGELTEKEKAEIQAAEKRQQELA
jgi:hypothetical protein